LDPGHHPKEFTHLRDVVVVVVLVVLTGILCVRFDVAERLRHLTTPLESLQLDELPLVFLATALGLVWFSWRRYRDAQRQVCNRRIAEARLESAVVDNRRLAQRYVNLQESERKHLTRELHDEFGQYLNGIKLDAVAIRDHSGDPPLAVEKALGIIEGVDHVQGVAQDMIRRFRPVGLDELGLEAALEHCVAHWRERLPGTELVLSSEGSFDDLSEPVALAIYRLVQEALTNVSTHAHASRATIRLSRVTGETAGRPVRLIVSDNGVGRDLTSRHSGLGVIGMRERVEMLEGSFKVSSVPGQGFMLSATLPATSAPAVQ
jgi:two-component system, NarL family, sensor histidine kinase UhpB